jgi:mannose-6-phosphate isomerase-like protein (cupin superfamily)
LFKDFVPVPNHCNQILREVERQPNFSIAHVTMNSLEESILHRHDEMIEAYVIAKGFGVLCSGIESHGGWRRLVTAGSVITLEKGQSHKLVNLGAGTLEHLVIASPPFDPGDVHEVKIDMIPGYGYQTRDYPVRLPEPEDCFDGARILSYSLPAEIDLSVAFGWVINDPARQKKPHYHEKNHEWVYVVEGDIHLASYDMTYGAGSWLSIPPGVDHGFLNLRPEALCLIALCSPKFSMEDVYHR